MRLIPIGCGLSLSAFASMFLFALPGYAQLVQPTGDAQLAAQVVNAPPEPTLTETFDLNSAVEAYAQVQGVSMEKAWARAFDSVGLTAMAAKPTPRFKYQKQSPGVFTITAPESYMRMVPNLIESLRCGNKQIMLSVRFLSVSDEMRGQIGNALASGWKIGNLGEADSLAIAENDAKPEDVRAKQFSPFRMESARLNPLKDGGPVWQAGKTKIEATPASFVYATSKTVVRTPCRYALVGDGELQKIIETVQGDTRSNILQAPKVTVFPGQSASVSDSRQRPFVVSVNRVEGPKAIALEPVIEVLTEGLTLDFTTDLIDGGIELASRISFGKIGKVDTFTFRPAGTWEDTTVQLPEFREQSVNLAQQIQAGQSLLIAPQFFEDVKQPTAKNLLGLAKPQPPVRRYYLMILSPEVIDEPESTD